MKVARKYKENVELHQSYIDIVLRFAGYRLSDMYTSVLGYSSYYGTINKHIKDELAKKNNTSSQVISNAITKLRKLGLLNKNIVIEKLRLPSSGAATITFMLMTDNDNSAVKENKPTKSNKSNKSTKPILSTPTDVKTVNTSLHE